MYPTSPYRQYVFTPGQLAKRPDIIKQIKEMISQQSPNRLRARFRAYKYKHGPEAVARDDKRERARRAVHRESVDIANRFIDIIISGEENHAVIAITYDPSGKLAVVADAVYDTPLQTTVSTNIIRAENTRSLPNRPKGDITIATHDAIIAAIFTNPNVQLVSGFVHKNNYASHNISRKQEELYQNRGFKALHKVGSRRHADEDSISENWLHNDFEESPAWTEYQIYRRSEELSTK